MEPEHASLEKQKASTNQFWGSMLIFRGVACDFKSFFNDFPKKPRQENVIVKFAAWRDFHSEKTPVEFHGIPGVWMNS